MQKLSHAIVRYFEKQRAVVVSTINKHGHIHCAVKGIVGIEPKGVVYVIDLYHHRTFENLNANPTVSITAVNEERFQGYTLQGNAKIVQRENIADHIVEAWEKKILNRISERIIKSVQAGEKTQRHHEAELPQKPKYLIEIDITHVIDLSPPDQKINK